MTNQVIKIEPPLTYETPALLCDSSNRLVYPTKFSDGSLFGGSFQRITDGAGQITLSRGRIGSTLTFGGRRINASHGLRLRVRGLTRRLRRGHRVRLRLTVRDEFGDPARAVRLTMRGAAGRLTALTDGHGRVTLTLRPRKRGRATLASRAPATPRGRSAPW